MNVDHQLPLQDARRNVISSLMTEEEKRKQWYVVHVLAGQENKVHDNLIKRVKTEEMGDYIYEVVAADRARLRDQARQEDRDDAQVFPGLPHREHVAARREQAARRQDLVFHQGDPRRDRLRRHQGSPDPDAPVGSRRHARAGPRREDKVKPKISSASARPSKSPTVPSKTRAASSRKSIPSAASCASPSPSSAATRSSTSNTGRSSAPNSPLSTAPN